MIYVGIFRAYVNMFILWSYNFLSKKKNGHIIYSFILLVIVENIQNN